MFSLCFCFLRYYFLFFFKYHVKIIFSIPIVLAVYFLETSPSPYLVAAVSERAGTPTIVGVRESLRAKGRARNRDEGIPPREQTARLTQYTARAISMQVYLLTIKADCSAEKRGFPEIAATTSHPAHERTPSLMYRIGILRFRSDLAYD